MFSGAFKSPAQLPALQAPETNEVSTLGKSSYSPRTSGIQIHLLSPSKLTDGYTVRPYRFSLSPTFQQDFVAALDDAVKQEMQSIGNNIPSASMFRGMRGATEFIRPAQDGSEIDLRQIETKWRFIIVLDNPEANTNFRTHKLSRRLLYTGIIFGEEEPVIQRFGRYIISERAMLVCTHCTTLDVHVRRDEDGESQQFRNFADITILNPQIQTIQNSSFAERDFVLTPGKVAKSAFMAQTQAQDTWPTMFDDEIERTHQTGEYTDPTECMLSASGTNILQPSKYNSPRHQLAQIFDGAFRTVMGITRSGILSPDLGGGYATNVDRYSTGMLFAQNVGGRVPDSGFGLNLRQTGISLKSIVEQYRIDDNGIFVHQFDPDAFTRDTLLEAAPNPIAIFSSVIKSSVPTIFANYGISDCSFRWASSDPVQCRFIADRRAPIYKPELLLPFIEEEPRVTAERFRAAVAALYDDVLVDVECAIGEIELLVMYQHNGDTVVQLQARDNDEINHQVAVQHNCLGGLNSPVLGNNVDYTNQTNVLEGIVDITCEYAAAMTPTKTSTRFHL